MTRFISFLPLVLVVLCLGSCDRAQNDTSSATGEVEIPELLPRPEALQTATEWDRTQSGYMQLQSKLLTEDPDDIESRITLAKIFVNEARVTGEHGHYYPAALKMLDEALELNHRKGHRDQNLEFDALSTKAGVQLSQHEFADALQTAQDAILINPYNARVYGAVVDAQVELGNYDAAVKAADKMNEIRPDLRSYSRVSYLREIHGDVGGAIEAMEQAVRAGAPGYESTAWARLTLGELHERYGKEAAARKVYESILIDRPNYPFAIAALGDMALKKQDYAEAEKRLKKAANIIPEVGYYVSLAQLYKETGRTEEQTETEAEIMEMLQDDVDSGHNMDLEYAAFYRDQKEDYDRALEYVKAEHVKRPDNIDVNRMYADLLMRMDRSEDAAPYLAKASATNSKHPELLRLTAK